MNSELVYRLADLEKTYNSRTVISIDALEVYRSEILSIVGPSGSGKSTLLRILNFLEYPESGWLEFDGQRFDARNEIPLESRRRVTTVFQRPLLLNRSVWDNVTYGLRLRGEKDWHEKARMVLAQVGLEHLSRQRTRLLSGGEAQRVALARAIVLRPEVLLLDEPTANLDPYNVGLIESIVQQTNQDQGTTLVLVTHNVFQAKRMAQRVAFILNGRLVEVNQVEPFFSTPQDARTRAFVNGEMVY
jgi:tungstate transport system ATP-binding protein